MDIAWKEEFIRLLSQSNEQEADNLKSTYMPKRLFKYRGLDEYTLKSLTDDYVYLGSVRKLNDPYECSYSVQPSEMLRKWFALPSFKSGFSQHFGRDISDDAVNEIVNAPNPHECYTNVCRRIGINITLPSIADMYANISEPWRDIIKVSCFSERNDSLLMWSHYANHHRGICVEYDFQPYPNLCREIQPVYYTNNLYDVTNTIFSDISRDGFTMALYISSLTKALDWAYEQEWRLIGTPSHSDLWKVPTPTAIYLGVQFDLNDQLTKDSITKIAQSKDIPLIKMQRHLLEYTVTPQQPSTVERH